MNHAARPPAFSYVRSQGPRGMTIRTGVKAQPSPGLSGRQSPSAGKAKRSHNAAWVRVRVRVRIVLRTARLVADTPGHRSTLVAFLAVLVSC